MTPTDRYMNERLDHLGIVAGVCQEIGLAAWLDAQGPGNRQQVSVGKATVAMILNGLGWSLRQLYLVPQYFANKRLNTCWVWGSRPRCSMTTVWGAHWIGCMRTTRRNCLLGWSAERGRSLASRPVRCMWTRPPSRSAERTITQVSECRRPRPR